MIYAVINEGGFVDSFLPVSVFGPLLDADGQRNPAIPEDAVEIDEATWKEWHSHSRTRRYDRALGRLVTAEPPVPTVEERRATLRRKAAAKRFQVETGGIAWEEMPVATDRESQAKLAAAYQAARDGWRTEGAGWKFKDGVTRPLGNAAMIAMAQAVAAHVQRCYDTEAAILSSIDAAIDHVALDAADASIEALA